MNVESAKSEALSLQKISKKYGNFYALNGLDVHFETGRIHALVGQNGAGKSTCLGLIAGRIQPTTGTLKILGDKYLQGLNPKTAAKAGIATVYQELAIFPNLTAIENVFINQLKNQFSIVNWNKFRPQFNELCKLLITEIDPFEIASNLSLAKQQMLEIMRGMALNSRVLLLDEPTAVLAPEERESLFNALKDLKKRGVTIIFVSHFLDEVLSVSDTVSVFRNGELIEKADVKAWTEETLVDAMLGEEAAQLKTASQERSSKNNKAELLSITGLTVGKISSINLTVNEGEIVGIGGLVGSGRSTLLRAISGAQKSESGQMHFEGIQMPLPRNPRQAWKQQIAYIPEERKTQGLALESSATDNIIVGDLNKVSTLGWIVRKKVTAITETLSEKFNIPSRLLLLPAHQLSGGNQQKVLFARWGLRQPKLLLADEATRGVDIGAKGQIMLKLREMASQGMGVIFVSSDLEEVASISDRIYVFSHGQLAGEIHTTTKTTQDDILRLAFGLKKEESLNE